MDTEQLIKEIREEIAITKKRMEDIWISENTRSKYSIALAELYKTLAICCNNQKT